MRIPKSVNQALVLYKSDGNTLWWEAILREMKNIRISFEFYVGNAENFLPDINK